MIISRWGKPCIDALRPGPRDLVVMTTVGGRIEVMDHVCDYDRAIQHALDLAEEQRGYVKVFTMTLMEAVLFCGITPAQFMADITDDEDEALALLAYCGPKQ
jgi:hypothetical protein